MKTFASVNPDGTLWKELYAAALLESDPGMILERIAIAEQVIVARAHELFRTKGDVLDEGEALDDALYLLRALKGCLEHQSVEALAA